MNLKMFLFLCIGPFLSSEIGFSYPISFYKFQVQGQTEPKLRSIILIGDSHDEDEEEYAEIVREALSDGRETDFILELSESFRGNTDTMRFQDSWIRLLGYQAKSFNDGGVRLKYSNCWRTPWGFSALTLFQENFSQLVVPANPRDGVVQQLDIAAHLQEQLQSRRRELGSTTFGEIIARFESRIADINKSKTSAFRLPARIQKRTENFLRLLHDEIRTGKQWGLDFNRFSLDDFFSVYLAQRPKYDDFGIMSNLALRIKFMDKGSHALIILETWLQDFEFLKSIYDSIKSSRNVVLIGGHEHVAELLLMLPEIFSLTAEEALHSSNSEDVEKSLPIRPSVLKELLQSCPSISGLTSRVM